MKWSTRITALHQYATREQTAHIPTNHIEHTADGPVPLGTWVNYIRRRGRNGQLAQPRYEQLAQIPGWTWEPGRPGPKTEPGRDSAILEMRKTGASLQKIGDQFGLSRQRVHQILKGAGL